MLKIIMICINTVDKDCLKQQVFIIDRKYADHISTSFGTST